MNRLLAMSLSVCSVVSWPGPGSAEEAARVRAALQRAGTLEFANRSLGDIAERLETQLKVKVVIHESLKPLLEARAQHFAQSASPPDVEGGEGPPLPGFSCELRGLRLGTALRVFLDHYGLGYAIQGDTLVIADAEKAERLAREQPIDARFDKQPLARVADELSRRYGVEIALDPKAPRDREVSLSLDELTLDEAIRLLAESVDLQAAPVGAGWLLTTPERARAWEARHQQQAEKARKEWVDPWHSPGQAFEGALGAGGTFGGLGGAVAVVPSKTPRALLQIAGPPARQGEAVAAAQEAAKPAPALPAKKSAAAEVLKKLNDPSDVLVDGPATFKDFLEQWERHGLPAVVVDQSAFKTENPDSPDIHESQVRLPRSMKGLPAGQILRHVLRQLGINNATYLVRPGYITVTTISAAQPNQQFVQASFVNRPLDEALAELAEMTGVGVVLDPRVGDKARAPITARFAAETNLAQAVRLLADMADLRGVMVDTVMYVTNRANSSTFPQEPLGPGAYTREAVQ